MYGYVRARMPREADAEDVVAEAYLRAARAFSTFDPSRAKFSTWVITIARNCMVSFLRKEKPTSALDETVESTLSVSGGQEAVDDRDYVYRLLAVLDDFEHELILLKYRDGMRNVDIAKEYDMNSSTVSTKLANALVKMRKAAERMQDGRCRQLNIQ